MVGGLVARDLADDGGFVVTAWDSDPSALHRLPAGPHLTSRLADLADEKAVGEAVREADVVAVAVPGRLGARVVRAVLTQRKPLVDISFSPEDPFLLDDLARRGSVPAVVDCGVAPGISNLLAGRAVSELSDPESVRILVGGLPSRRIWPWEYGLVFSLTDVLEEYTRPARCRIAGVERIVPALSELEHVEIRGLGTLEAFLTDGSRTLLKTLEVPNLVEKTLRWPGHAEKIRILRSTGFLDTEPVSTGAGSVVPRQLTEALLARSWSLPEGDEELTVLRVEVEGTRRGESVRIVYDLLDRTDPRRGTTSMARTTGFPCAIVARMLATGQWSRPGITPPEWLGRDATVTAHILDQLTARGVRIVRREEPSSA
jgi:saccharopine dehydrogenase-like NADP-dependent oxidoreductase